MVCGRRSLPTRQSQSMIDDVRGLSTATLGILSPESRDIILMRLDSLREVAQQHGSGVLSPLLRS